MIRTYMNARVFTGQEGDQDTWAKAFVVDGRTITHVGSQESAKDFAPSAPTVDLGGRLVLPGFTDAHTHLLHAGSALGMVGLTDAQDLAEIQRRVAEARKRAPDAERVWGRGWLFDAVDGRPTAQMLDEVVPDVPVYLDANDLHSCWVNSVALAEMGLSQDTPDPLGGSLGRDANGELTGMLYETAAIQHVWAQRDKTTTDAERDQDLDRVVDAYLAAGVTGVVDMALDEWGWNALQRKVDRHGGDLPLHVAAHWLVGNTGDTKRNLDQVHRAIELSKHSAGRLRVVGVKLILDGVIDACTAALGLPYADGSNAQPIWSAADLVEVVTAADRAGLQIALHAIGDYAADIALDALESAAKANGQRPRRHRIEHLEYARPGTAERMTRLGVTASMQPVHADPAIFENWRAMIGDHRVDRAFAWLEYEQAGTLLAFSTDAPTAPHYPLHNLYVASTRASALNPHVKAVQPHLAVSLENAIRHATRDAAASVADGVTRGMIASGHSADFVVIDADPFAVGTESLLQSRALATFVSGEAQWCVDEGLQYTSRD